MTDTGVDADLWSNAVEGDSRAFTALFDRHHPSVFSAMRRAGADHYEAEDAMAAAFFELWRKRRQVRLVNDSLRPWLIVTALNAHRNRVRTAMRYRATLARLHILHVEDDAEREAEERLVADQRASALRRGLRSLSATDAAVIVLVDLEGEDQARVGQFFGISAGALRTRLHRARSRLREHLVLKQADLFAPEEQG